MTSLHLTQLTGGLRSEPSLRPRTPSWRTNDWLNWRDHYLGETRPADRLAWIGVSRGRCRLATLEDLWLGGLQIRTGQPVETGMVLRVELIQGGQLACQPLTVRVISATRKKRDWLLNCCFAATENYVEIRTAALAG